MQQCFGYAPYGAVPCLGLAKSKDFDKWFEHLDIWAPLQYPNTAVVCYFLLRVAILKVCEYEKEKLAEIETTNNDTIGAHVSDHTRMNAQWSNA